MIPERQYRHIPKDDIPAYEATGWRVVADYAGCHHGAHAVLMELEEAAESVGDVTLRAVEEFASRMAGPIAHGTTSTPGESERFHGDDFTEPALPDADGRHSYSVFGGNFPQG